MEIVKIEIDTLKKYEGITLSIHEVAAIIKQHAKPLSPMGYQAAEQMLLSFLDDVDKDDETNTYNAVELYEWLGY